MAAKRTDVETGSDLQPLPQGFGSSFAEKAIRAQFIRKVYAILLGQMILTTCIIALFCFTPAIRHFYCTKVSEDAHGLLHCQVASMNGIWMYIGSYIAFIIIYLMLMCRESVRKNYPGNVVALLGLTLSISLVASSIAIYHDVVWVMMAVGITALLCLGLTLFSFQTRIDFTGIGIYLFAAFWILFIFGTLSMILWAKSYPILHLVYASLIALVFSGFLIYHTQLIIGGKKHSISPEEHILAAIVLYVDIVNIFLAILGMGRR
eukprot:maker-scaffold1570_size35393-snap-gene-0.14 protein:Tk03599 transcript:maker-scaffold1570_size35393-snap-gene-0.14-mRNA-1 annotation:"hypothetical protein LOTGIDRAFT_212296"